MADIYALLSNSSDVTALTRPGLDVLNIALLDGLEDYHTPQDTIASQDLRSVQHMGDIALGVIRRLAGERDPDVDASLVYTDIASRALVAAPSWAAQAVLAICIFVQLGWRFGAGAPRAAGRRLQRRWSRSSWPVRPHFALALF